MGDALVERLQAFRSHGVHVLGSFIFGLPSDRAATFEATADLAERAGITFATVRDADALSGYHRFRALGTRAGWRRHDVAGIPITRHWLIPQVNRPKAYAPHPVMSPDEIRRRTQAVWDHFYSLPRIWRRSRVVKTWKARLAFVLQLKVVSTDVCQHRDCDRFRATHPIGACRPLDGGAVPPALCRRPDAAPRSAPR